MPENYQSQMDELNREFEEKVRLARIEMITKKLPLILEQRQLLERKLAGIKEHNRQIEQINREKKDQLNGISDPSKGIRGLYEQHFESHPGQHRDALADYDNDYLVPANIIDENGKEQTLFPYSRDEINELEKEIDELNKTYNDNFEERKKAKSEVDKSKRENRLNAMNRKSKIQEAYKFLTYLDTATTTGYPNLANLTEDEVLEIYSDFYDKKNEPGYQRIWNETMNRMQKNDREIVSPQNKEDLKENNQDEKNDQEPEMFGPPESLKYEEPEIFGPPTPEGMVENPEETAITQVQKFNNNSTCLLTEGQIIALRNRGINVPFNKPGQTKLTEEQIAAINGAGISTVDLTEPGNKTVEELTGMKDPTQPEEYVVREYVEDDEPIQKTEEILDESIVQTPEVSSRHL